MRNRRSFDCPLARPAKDTGRKIQGERSAPDDNLSRIHFEIGLSAAEEGFQFLDLMVGEVNVVSGALGVGGVHGLLGLCDVGAQVGAGGDHVSAETKPALMHLLLERIEAAFDRSRSAIEMVDFFLHLVELLLLLKSGLLLGLDVGG
jgi:hypothetical protein